jgi:stage II sporulation protein AA (anti-sigma F factor antagonist)
MIESQDREEITIIKISGPLDTRQSRELDAMLEKMIKEKKHFFVFELTDMHFLSTSGIQILLKTLRSVKDLKGNLALCGLNAVVKKALNILSLDDVFTITENVEDAQKALGA